MKTINTKQLTFNQSVTAQVFASSKGVVKAVKRHVAGIGYVLYGKDALGNNLSVTSKMNGFMHITIL